MAKNAKQTRTAQEDTVETTEQAAQTTEATVEQTTKAGSTLNPLVKGGRVFIRTVTFFYTGDIAEITTLGPVLVNAAWIPDTGRFGEAMKTGQFSEVEPYPDELPVLVSAASIVDVNYWPHPLPRQTK